MLQFHILYVVGTFAYFGITIINNLKRQFLLWEKAFFIEYVFNLKTYYKTIGKKLIYNISITSFLFWLKKSHLKLISGHKLTTAILFITCCKPLLYFQYLKSNCNLLR